MLRGCELLLECSSAGVSEHIALKDLVVECIYYQIVSRGSAHAVAGAEMNIGQDSQDIDDYRHPMLVLSVRFQEHFFNPVSR